MFVTVRDIYKQSWALAHPSAQLPYFLGAQEGLYIVILDEQLNSCARWRASCIFWVHAQLCILFLY